MFAVVGRHAQAHEGHAALPTKGTQVDGQQGTVFLSREARNALAIATAEAELRSVEKSVLAYAKLESPWTKHAFATSRAGGRIERLFVKPGQLVKEGEPLAEVRSLELENLQLDLLNAHTEWTLSSKLTTQRERLVREGAIAGRDALEAEAKHRENEISVKVARLKLKSLGWTDAELDQFVTQEVRPASRLLTITSPIGGVVIHTDLTVGRVVEPNEHLFEIVDLSTVWVRLGILEKDIFQVAAGQPVELRLAAFPGRTFKCQVQVKSLGLEPTSRLGTAWAELRNPKDGEPMFLPGMNGQARIVVYAPGKRTTVSASAVVGEGAERFVLVEEEATEKGSLFRKRNVIVDFATPERVFLRDGKVFPGDRVLTQGAHILASYFAAGVLKPSEEAKKNIGLRIEAVRQRNVETTIELDGAVDVPPDHRAAVSPQLAGTLEQIHIVRGQTVQAGDVIAELASLEFQNLQLAMLQADQQVRLLTEQRKLVEGLSDGQNQVVARRRIWELESAHASAVHNRDTARRKLESVGLTRGQVDAILSDQQLLKTLPIRAPIAGAIVHFDKAIGQALKTDETLFEIHDLSRVWIQAYLSERQWSRDRLDPASTLSARVRLTAHPTGMATGKVVRSGRVFGDETRALSVWIELDGPTATVWQHDMLASVTLSNGPAATVLAIPKEAIAWDGMRAYAFVQRADGVLERRAVETGRMDDRYTEIISGLKATEMIAVTATADLQTAYATLR
jgi:RND family efflux transporter MFP subunit